MHLLQKQVEQKPPDFRRACPDIDAEFARFIDGALRKEPKHRIADWDDIRAILKPLNQSDLGLAPNELAVVINFRDSAYQHSARVVNTIQKLLKEEGINHEIKMHHGGNS